MPCPTDIFAWLFSHFSTNKQRTAQVLTGPKRETWFSAESFVALAGAGGPDAETSEDGPLTYWGECQFSTFFSRIEAPLGQGALKRKPDIVCSLPIMGEDAIDTVIEIKLILNDEKSDDCLLDLKEQMLNARQLFPKANVLGALFVAAAPLITPGTFSKKLRQIESCVAKTCPPTEGFRWVSDQPFREIFASVGSGFAYPAMMVSLSLGIVELVGGKIEQPAPDRCAVTPDVSMT